MRAHPLLFVLALSCAAAGAAAASQRQTISLDGQWDIAEGTLGQIPSPAQFTRRAPVPGLADMAEPAFVGVGLSNRLRGAFYYRRTFRVQGGATATAVLKIHKAAYGSKVFLNGISLGGHLASFTPGYFNARAALRFGGATNELIIRVGASRDAVPRQIPSGWDFEKVRYIPGIFDSVELILTGAPKILRVQTAPDLTNGLVRIQAILRNVGPARSATVRFIVREAKSRRVCGESAQTISLEADGESLVEARLPVRPLRLWSPEDPFLYELETDSGGDNLRVRFGMREFHFDPVTGRAMLNGRVYFLRGSNVTLYRFFEDAQRGDKPWRAEWVRRLHRRFKEMHWQTLRYCIGFPPDFWYDIADEEGFLIQDEFPIWQLTRWPAELKSNELAREYADWMHERWNHPCVVIWDAQNETRTDETGRAIEKVRALDLSHRPWDNGWGPAQSRGDSHESHPYLFSNPHFRLEDLEKVSGVPRGNALPNSQTNAIVINEYGWLWLNRDGTPTTLTRQVYENLLGANATPEQRRIFYARALAALTEFWRGHRACAGVLHFCGLGYSRPNGQTSDHFTDLENLTFEPNFYRCVRDAFAPVGVMLDFWAAALPPGPHATRVRIFNDLYEPWNGQIRLRVRRGTQVVEEQFAEVQLPPLGAAEVNFQCAIPDQPGPYQLEAALVQSGKTGPRSLRDFQVAAGQRTREP